MSKGGKMFDAIMITIIIIASLNYADYIKVDTKLMMVLLAIALYVTAKQTQKSNQKIQKSQKVEPLDGSAVAFDKDAFVNLNAIVNELVKKDSVTIPGNLVVLGKTTFKDDVSINDGKGMLFLNKAYARFGEGAANRRDQYDGEIAYGRHGEALCIVGSGKERNIFTWGHLTSKEGGTLNCTYLKCDDLSANNNITAGTDDANMIRIRQNRVGTKGCGEMEFRSDGWIRHFTYGSGNYRANCGFAASTLYSRDHIHNQGTLRVDGATDLKGTLTAQGITCNSALTVTGDIKAGGNAYANAYLYKNNGNQGLLFNQGDRELRLATGKNGATLDFHGAAMSWYMGTAPNRYYDFRMKSNDVQIYQVHSGDSWYVENWR